jgi:tetratricopeptide (TPR) repeat protein
MRKSVIASSLAVVLLTGLVGSALAKGKDDDDMEFAPDEVKRSPPSKILERAIKLYEKKDYYSASIEFYKVTDKQTQDSEANRQRAEFFMGKTLYQMGFYAGSLAQFEKIVNAGDAHRYHGATLKWLAALSRVLPETSGILDKIGSYQPEQLDDPVMAEVRDELYFLLGRHFYQKAKFDEAIDLFGRVDAKSPFYVRAKFFEGVTHVRKYEGKPAVDAFKQILVIAEEKPKWFTRDEIDTYQELAELQMARIFYSTQQYDKSIKYYEKLDQDSPDWLNTLFEASWAYFMKTNNSKALGNIHTLNAPYFENTFWPESILLKAVIYYKYCLWDRALEAVAEYNQNFKPLRQNLKDILGKYDDNAEFYDYIQKIFDNKAGLDQTTQRLVLSVLGDKTLKKTFDWVTELDKELAMLQKADQAWQTTAIAGEVLAQLTLQQSLAKADAGKLARERVERLMEELKEWSRDGLKIRIQVLEAKAGNVTATAKGEQITGSHKEEPIIVDDEHFMWRFNGEYWKDELGYYRFRIRSKCPEKGAPQ